VLIVGAQMDDQTCALHGGKKFRYDKDN
jgi:hypothetical protein